MKRNGRFVKHGKVLVCLSLMVLCLCGCGDKVPEDSNEYRLERFSFSVPEWLYQGEHSKSESDEKINYYEFWDSNSSVRLSVGDMYNNTEPEAFMDNESAINGFPWDYIEDCPYTSAQTPIKFYNGKDGIEAYVFSDTYFMFIEASFDSSDKSTAEKAIKEIAETAYYCGEVHLTDKPQKYKNKFFSIEYEPKFYLAENQTKRDEDLYFYDILTEDGVDMRTESGYKYDSDMENCEKCVFMSYGQAETVMKSTLDLSVCVFSHDYYEHCGVAVADDYNEMNEFESYDDLEMSESYFGDYPSYENNCIYKGDQKLTCVYFDKGDHMYRIEYSYPLDDVQAENDIHELLDGITIK